MSYKILFRPYAKVGVKTENKSCLTENNSLQKSLKYTHILQLLRKSIPLNALHYLSTTDLTIGLDSFRSCFAS
jgi:hypothetical protein